MVPYATIEDYQRRYGPVLPDQCDRLDVLLTDATAYISALLTQSEAEDEPSEEYLHNLMTVTCAVVHRMMIVTDDRIGVTQFSQTAGSYTESGTMANPNGDMYLTAAEKRLLGISATGKPTKATFWRPAIHREDGTDVAGW